MKKVLIEVFFVFVVTLFISCGHGNNSTLPPDELSTMEIEIPQVTEQTPSPEPAPAPSPRTAEEVLPPVEKNIFPSERDGIYLSSISAAPDFLMVVLADGDFTGRGMMTLAPSGGDRDENGFHNASRLEEDLCYVSCSQFNIIAVDSTGALWGYGIIDYWGNILGMGGSPEPLRYMTDVQMASAGSESYLALRRDGTVWMWGSGSYGELGGGPEYIRYTWDNPLLEPVKVMEDVIYAEIDGCTCYAIKTDNSLWTWGWGHVGGNNVSNGVVCFDRPVHIMDDVSYVEGSLAVKTDGTLWSLYSSDDEVSEPVFKGVKPEKIMDNVRLAGGLRTAGGQDQFYAIKNDGSLWVWGDNTGGALGDGTEEYADKPMKIMDGVLQVSINMDFRIYILKENGELWETGIPYGTVYEGPEADYPAAKEAFLQSARPHKILDGVLVR